ncbi:MAG TPA: hypothetical protein VGO78_17935 [Acidimicrobiales bacterium]|nr:hypothetical protein [Acidimicrobiales bacterium]
MGLQDRCRATGTRWRHDDDAHGEGTVMVVEQALSWEDAGVPDAATTRPAGWALTPRAAAGSIDELVAGATRRQPFHADDGKSGSGFERVEIDGRRYVLKTLHVDDDWIARSLGDLGCRPAVLWTTGLLDAVPSTVDHTVVGVATGLGRHGWGAALLMHDVGDRLIPEGDATVSLADHAGLIDGLARLSAHFWGWHDDIGLLPPSIRWSFFGPGMLEVERRRGWPHPVPRIAADGWERFATRAPAPVADLVTGLRHEPWVLVEALQTTPWTLLQGDWKMGNLGRHPDGRTILLDWAYPGEGPAGHDLAWYLALNRARLPESKEATIDRFRQALERHGVDTAGWWERQLGLCLLGALVQFGWEKALGSDEELTWWTEAAQSAAHWL